MMLRVLILLFLISVGCISGPEKETIDFNIPEAVVEEGDFVKVEITGIIEESGEGFYERGPLNFTLGHEEIFPSIERAMLGMKVGGERNISLSPEEGYGERASEKVQTMQRTAILPKFIELPISNFKTIFDKEPEINDTLKLKYWQARVVDISGPNATLLYEPENNTEINTDYGPAIVTLNDTHITTTLTPELGAFIITELGAGVIQDINESSIVVDFNHLLAGKTLVFEIRIIEITKPG